MTDADKLAALDTCLAKMRADIQAWHGHLVEENGNREAGPFLRLTMEENKERNGGCSILTSHPFALVMWDRAAAHIIACAVPSEKRKNAVGLAPWFCTIGFSHLTARDADSLRAWAQTSADEYRVRIKGSDPAVEVWAADTLAAFGDFYHDRARWMDEVTA